MIRMGLRLSRIQFKRETVRCASLTRWMNISGRWEHLQRNLRSILALSGHVWLGIGMTWASTDLGFKSICARREMWTHTLKARFLAVTKPTLLLAHCGPSGN